MVIFGSITGRSKVGLKKGKKLHPNRKILLGMFAFGALGAEADEPIGAHDLSNVATFTVRTVLAEAARVPGTLLYF